MLVVRKLDQYYRMVYYQRIKTESRVSKLAQRDDEDPFAIQNVRMVTGKLKMTIRKRKRRIISMYITPLFWISVRETYFSFMHCEYVNYSILQSALVLIPEETPKFITHQHEKMQNKVICPVLQ